MLYKLFQGLQENQEGSVDYFKILQMPFLPGPYKSAGQCRKVKQESKLSWKNNLNGGIYWVSRL